MTARRTTTGNSEALSRTQATVRAPELGLL
jgi:hypothetical protein